MSLTRSPSPERAGDWSSPGLTTPVESTSRRPSPILAISSASQRNVPWKSTTSSSSRSDHRSRSPLPPNLRPMSNFGRSPTHLPSWRSREFPYSPRPGGGTWQASQSWNNSGRILPFFGRILWKLRVFILFVVLLVVSIVVVTGPMLHSWRRSRSLGGGSNFVIMLGTNLGGGVMEWKGPREWAIERDSIRNKKDYAKRWGYELEELDMSTKKRYAHEWRESWEKVDNIRNTMRKYPDAEWFWWLDLHTFVMEPGYSLQSHIFRNLQSKVYRDINVYNPLNITHPLTDPWLDELSRSANGDGTADSINLIIPQDCGGFNLGSFLIRRSAWTDRLLDVWWDPVGYEQKHMDWEHKEQDALEWMYANQPWVRPHVAFLPQRRINSFPPGACNDAGTDKHIHYDSTDRDFLVNMAGCQWGRDCWAEMFEYRKLSETLNRNVAQKLRDWILHRDMTPEKAMKADQV